MEIEIKKSDSVKNGQISTMDAFSAKDFIGFKKGRKSNWPSVQYRNGKDVKSVTFNLTEFAEANESLRVEKDDETYVVTLPDSAFAEEGDRFPRPVM